MVIDAINEGLRRKQLSDAAASKLAVGHPSLIKNLRMPRDGDKRYNWTALEKLAEVLDLELYFGPPRARGPILTAEIDGAEYAGINRYDAQFSAGYGAENVDTNQIGAIAFRRDWMSRMGISPSQSLVVTVKGDSMAPTLSDGDLVLVDQGRQMLSKRRIYALVGADGDAKIKRVEKLEAMLLLHSDNADYPTEAIPADEADRLKILGEVVWWGHSVEPR